MSVSKISQAKLWCQQTESKNTARVLDLKYFLVRDIVQDADTWAKSMEVLRHVQVPLRDEAGTIKPIRLLPIWK